MCEQDMSSYLSMFGGPLIFVLAVFGSATGPASILKRFLFARVPPTNRSLYGYNNTREEIFLSEALF